jgi:hypothetical protein
MCLPETIAARLKSAETMETAWIRLDAWFRDRGLFIKALMQDIKNVPLIKDRDHERMMDYYVMLRLHIAEARNADMLVIPASVEMMAFLFTTWEKRVWRETQGMLPAEGRAWYVETFVEDLLRYAIDTVATSEQHVLPKPIPLHRPQRSPSSDG